MEIELTYIRERRFVNLLALDRVGEEADYETWHKATLEIEAEDLPINA